MKKRLTVFYETVLCILPRRAAVYAANASFFIILSAFPALLLLLSVLNYIPLTVEELETFMDAWLPETIAPLLDEILAEMVLWGRSITLVSVSALTALWSAARGVLGVLNGLNEVYGLEDHRGYFLRRALSGVYTVALAVAILMTLGLHLLGDRLRAAIFMRAAVVIQVWEFLIGIRALVVVPLLTVTFTVIYQVLPDRKASLRSQLPGAVLAALAWEGFSQLFSMYLDMNSSLSYMYGSLVTIAVAMLWLYFCMTILFYGGALNHFLEQRNRRHAAR